MPFHNTWRDTIYVARSGRIIRLHRRIKTLTSTRRMLIVIRTSHMNRINMNNTLARRNINRRTISSDDVMNTYHRHLRNNSLVNRLNRKNSRRFRLLFTNKTFFRNRNRPLCTICNTVNVNPIDLRGRRLLIIAMNIKIIRNHLRIVNRKWTIPRRISNFVFRLYFLLIPLSRTGFNFCPRLFNRDPNRINVGTSPITTFIQMIRQSNKNSTRRRNTLFLCMNFITFTTTANRANSRCRRNSSDERNFFRNTSPLFNKY